MAEKSLLTFLFLTTFGTFGFSQTIDGWFPYELSALDTTNNDFVPQFPIDVIEAINFVHVNAAGHIEVNGESIRFSESPIHTIDYDVDFSIAACDMRKDGCEYGSVSPNGLGTLFWQC